MFVAVDELLRPLYPHLTAADQCYFLREYTAGRGYAGSEANRLILNLEKPPDRRGTPEWRYKEQAIQQIAREFRASVNLSALRRVTLVPMPPSKAKGDPSYDDRMLGGRMRSRGARGGEEQLMRSPIPRPLPSRWSMTCV